MITEEENRIRNKFFEEKGIKAYEGHINDGGNIVWKEEYVKWLESKLSQHDVIKNEVAVCESDCHDLDIETYGVCHCCDFRI